LLVFYAGLEGWDCECEPALYIIGYFEVSHAGRADSFSRTELKRLFLNNFHVMHRRVFETQKSRLVLVKGGTSSRLLNKAMKISVVGKNKRGRPLHRLSPEMRKTFGGFNGHTSIQRSPPRWIAPEFTEVASRWVHSLE
jgi:hypothetical protein